MIYLDNAATTRHKPDCVVEAITRALCSLGNPGRGAHEGSLDADRVVFDTRLALAELFHAEGPCHHHCYGSQFGSAPTL